MILFILGILALTLSFINPRFLLRVIFIFSLALPTSNGTTHSFSILIGNYHLLYTDVLFLILLVPWGLKKLIKKVKKEPSNIHTFKIYLIFFLAWSLIGVFLGLIQNFKINQIIYDSRPIFYYLIIFIIIDLHKSEQGLINISKDLVLGLTLYCIITFSFIILRTANPLFSIFSDLFYGFNGRIVFGNDFYFLFALPLIVFIFNDRRLVFRLKPLILFILILFVIKIIVTMSRTLISLSFLCLLLSFFVNEVKMKKTILFKKKVMKLFYFLFLFLLMSGFAIKYVIPLLFKNDSAVFLNTIYERFYNKDSSPQGTYQVATRTIMYLTGVKEVLSSLFIGHGYGYMFKINHPEWYGKKISFVDSSLITIWIRSGIVGVLILIKLIIKCAKYIYIMVNDIDLNKNLYIRALSISMYAGGISFIFIILFNSILVNSTAILPLLIIVGEIIGFFKTTRKVNNY